LQNVFVEKWPSVVKVVMVADSAQPHVITADILRFLNMSLKDASLDAEPLVLAAMAGREYSLDKHYSRHHPAGSHEQRTLHRQENHKHANRELQREEAHESGKDNDRG
jgi:hypothetical protein